MQRDDCNLDPRIEESLGPGLEDAARSHYGHPILRHRILEFLGDEGLGPTAAYVATGPARVDRPFRPRPSAEVWELARQEIELSRSLADTRGLIAHVDLEHVHFDRPWDTYLRPERAFEMLAPVALAVAELLERHGIGALHVLTGRGHHWLWRIDSESQAFRELTRLGQSTLIDDETPAGPWLEPRFDAVAAPLEAAHRGLGLVMEQLANDVRASRPATLLSIQTTAVIVGAGPEGREIASLDLSAYADPLAVRQVRIPFSLYLKSRWAGLVAGLSLPPLIPIPWPTAVSLAEALSMRTLAGALEVARNVSATIPEADAGTARLISAYRRSPLSQWHVAFYAVKPERPADWPGSYDRFDLRRMPPCASSALARPNDLLLQPVQLQLLTRVLLAQGWHPRHIAGLVRSKLARDHGWSPGVHFFDPGQRADFYVRLFAAQVALGSDSLIDLNCVSAQEKKICPGVGCRWNLAHVRDSLRRTVSA